MAERSHIVLFRSRHARRLKWALAGAAVGAYLTLLVFTALEA